MKDQKSGYYQEESYREESYQEESYQEESNAVARTVEVLLEYGADVMARDDTFSMPLHLTLSQGSPEIARLLIEHGADVNAPDGDDMTPLHLTLHHVSVNTGASCYSTGRTDVKEQGLAPRMKSDVKTVQALLDHGADVTARDNTRSTPLHLASAREPPAIVQLLIEHGADVNVPDGNHKTPLHLAMRGHLETARLLIERGAYVNALDGDHSTPLHLASSILRLEIMRLLIERGADINARDGSDKTPLHLVSYSVSTESVVQLLTRHGLMQMDRMRDLTRNYFWKKSKWIDSLMSCRH